jgi:hypothetical protein
VTLISGYEDVLAWTDVKEGHWHTVAKGGFHRTPAWAPDGSRLAAVGNPEWGGKHDAVMLVSAVTDRTSMVEVRPPGPEVTDVRAVAWSPTGERLAVSALSNGHLYDVWVTPSSHLGTHWIRVTNDSHGYFGMLAWTSDGRGVVYARLQREGEPELLVQVDAAAKSEPRQFLQLPFRHGGWDQAALGFGGRLAVVEEDSSVVKIVQPGQATREIDLGARPVGPYAWNAEASRLAVVVGKHRLYVVEAGTGRVRLLWDSASPR